MTCKEKLIKDHPEWNEDKINEVVRADCPEYYMNIGDPDWCTPFTDACKKCWNREFPDTKMADPVPITKTDYDYLCASEKVDNNTPYQVYQTEEEVQEAKDALAAKRTYTAPETSIRNTQCVTCVHKDVCVHRENFCKIVAATQHSNGICAHVGKDTIDLNSTPYAKLDISCKHYHRKEGVRHGI